MKIRSSPKEWSNIQEVIAVDDSSALSTLVDEESGRKSLGRNEPCKLWWMGSRGLLCRPRESWGDQSEVPDSTFYPTQNCPDVECTRSVITVLRSACVLARSVIKSSASLSAHNYALDWAQRNFLYRWMKRAALESFVRLGNAGEIMIV